jgi:hypothetical protein
VSEAGAQARSEVEEALAELKRSRRRPYFDEAASRAALERYYAELGEAPDYETLSQLVRGTHRTLLRYAPMSQVYPWVDLHPDGLLRSIYSSKEFNPEELIREDARIDQLRGDRFREVLAAEGVGTHRTCPRCTSATATRPPSSARATAIPSSITRSGPGRWTSGRGSAEWRAPTCSCGS